LAKYSEEEMIVAKPYMTAVFACNTPDLEGYVHDGEA